MNLDDTWLLSAEQWREDFGCGGESVRAAMATLTPAMTEGSDQNGPLARAAAWFKRIAGTTE